MSDTTTLPDTLVLEGMRSPCGRLRLVRICNVSEDGTLCSPFQETLWTGPVMRAESWSDSKAVLGECGLHGIWDRWPDIVPEQFSQAVVRVLGDGRAVVSPWAARVERNRFVGKWIGIGPRQRFRKRVRIKRSVGITLDRLCADWSRLDLVKIDAEGAEALVWEGMQQTLRRFPYAAVLLELHLQRDPPQTVSLLHQIKRAGYALRTVGYEGDIVSTDAATILSQPQEHWALFLRGD